MSDDLSCASSSPDHEHSAAMMSSTEYSYHSSVAESKKSASSQGNDLAKIETKAVKRSKIFVLVILMIAAAACGTATFYYTTRDEANGFQNQFEDFALEIINESHHEARNIFRSVKSAATTTTSLAQEINATWPLLTVPHFIIRGAQVNRLSKALVTGFSPIILASDRSQWERYSVQNQGWIKESQRYTSEMMMTMNSESNYTNNGTMTTISSTDMIDIQLAPISPNIFRIENNEHFVETYDSDAYLPMWQFAPVPFDTDLINYNLLSHPVFSRIYQIAVRTKHAVLSEVFSLDFLFQRDSVHFDSINATHPHSVLLEPVFDEFHDVNNDANNSVVGMIYSVLPWDNYFKNILPGEVQGLILVVTNTCGEAFTYRLNGADAIYLGIGDLHEPKYNDLVITERFAPFVANNGNETTDTNKEYCEFLLNIYPSHELEDTYMTKRPIFYTTVVILVFFFTSMVFVMYDFLVQQRQDKVMATAKRSNAIVSSLFPSNVRDRILKDAEQQVEAEMNAKKTGLRSGATKHLRDFLGEEDDHDRHSVYGSKPIADLFPAATIMFADIVGFTAWSSVREPSQVFQLLETVYHAFDEIAKRRRVFKVETVGDCYVAVTGLPEPRKDHAAVMARFARDCLAKMNDLSKKLEVSLGPDTGDLSMRVGLHSGPVTAGVLRGDRSRFQLFGDTVNTASRMESNGIRNKIHMSQETADLLKAEGRSHWVKAREDKIFAKGKGELQTYWLEIRIQSSDSATSGETNKTTSTNDECEREDLVLPPVAEEPPAVPEAPGRVSFAPPVIDVASTSEDIMQVANDTTTNTNVAKGGRRENKKSAMKHPILSDKIERLVHWNTEVLLRLLKQVIARRNAMEKLHRLKKLEHSQSLELEEAKGTVIDEVKEIIKLPRFDAKVAKQQENPKDIHLSSDIATQLHDYVTVIATMYRDNPFHNFEHASHVTMSVVKLLSRIVAPEEVLQEAESHDDNQQKLNRNLHDHTYGITSDPLTQFAVVLSALVHDVDHSGVPNAQLVKEQASVANIYRNKSVAEQNSVDIAWDLLMDENFKDLRDVIYSNNSELKRFRQLIVNTVLATDIVDKELKELRNARWDKAFQEKSASPIASPTENNNHSKETREDVNRKATIVIEHLIQASDVAHTMQHWHIYRKWNERFFQENIRAYRAGRAEKDPAEFWYHGELGFFDFYIIPLAKKLKDCGVFGVSSDEYLNYAIANRKEWELKGAKVVAEMVERYKNKKFSYDSDQCKLGDHEKEEKRWMGTANH